MCINVFCTWVYEVQNSTIDSIWKKRIDKLSLNFSRGCQCSFNINSPWKPYESTFLSPVASQAKIKKNDSSLACHTD